MVVDSPAQNRQKLLQFLNEEVEPLSAILRVYIQRAGLPGGEDTLNELLNHVVVEALSHAQRYDPARPARAWLLGIAANLVRRRQAEAARLDQREPLAADLLETRQENLGEDELFELLSARAAEIARWDLNAASENHDRLSVCLGLLTQEQRRLILLFASGSLDGDRLAASLNVTPGAARVRLHRALAALRQVWFFSEEAQDND
jgi:RNA polymerase sigma-70 factor (ECF subfamily)